ncbi:phenylacetate-CoA oxygenase subunit PaaJ [Bacillus sp. ISL-47]|uniref:1,2-phenylacetyl-CoA epoxidase subunit PaaD n=1 Tax=Bacillus sp. ISL-47 TaxID=2819130 RepID=UPI001BEB4909|nr:1,2-phenylacetyl-CoA epoxidase subunit PaaD [Bacillus sp. ISL-47]MBT2688199.1 phenylacetate-CoA oxygenase subunit PaaJ [Bacillus sp. ISL-47]MBT2708487.1 phenylacetate-CoA oxygenase subunit PaaJ [Pseudomonas sp. ISL-84]
MEQIQVLEKAALEALHNVKDPEIDSISIVDLGMVEHLKVEGNAIMAELLPTFMGCPALDIIRKSVEAELGKLGIFEKIEVQFIYHPPWTSDRVTKKGRIQLKEFGIAPPPEWISETGEWHVECPFCGSAYTTMDNLFGPTACRSILYCKSCRNPFEAMKPVSTMM